MITIPLVFTNTKGKYSANQQPWEKIIKTKLNSANTTRIYAKVNYFGFV